MPSKLFRPGTTGVDGAVYAYVAGSPTWAAIRAYNTAEGLQAHDSTTSAGVVIGSGSGGGWWNISRGVVVFDTSELGSNVVVDSATLSLYGCVKYDGLSITPNINVYNFNKSSGSTIVSILDYHRIYEYGFIPACDTPIAYSGWDADGWNTFSLNAAGKDWIKPTSSTAFAVRNANYDVSGTAPAWSYVVNGDNFSGLAWWTRDASVDVAPKLTVYYHTATPSPTAPGTKKIISLEAVRNIEMESMGRAYIDKDGYFVYEGRYYRSY